MAVKIQPRAGAPTVQMAPAARERRPPFSRWGRHARERETSADDAGSCQRECPTIPTVGACAAAALRAAVPAPTGRTGQRSAFPCLCVIRSVGGPAQQHFHSHWAALVLPQAANRAPPRDRRPPAGIAAKGAARMRHANCSCRAWFGAARRDLPPQSGTASHQTFQIVEIVRGLVSAAAECRLDRKQQSQGAVLPA